MTLANAQQQYVKIPYLMSSKSGKNWQKFIYVPKEANYICRDVNFHKNHCHPNFEHSSTEFYQNRTKI